MIKLKDGYAKLVGTSYTGSNNSVLLAGGGHKALSEFNIGNYLPLAGGTMTGAISKTNGTLINYLHNTAGTNPIIKIGSNNLNTPILRIYSSDLSTPLEKSYGFTLRYRGDNSGDANNLVLQSDNLKADNPVDAITVNLSGATTFANRITALGLTISSENAINHIQFSRKGWNYLVTPDDSGTYIAFASPEAGDNKTKVAINMNNGYVGLADSKPTTGISRLYVSGQITAYQDISATSSVSYGQFNIVGNSRTFSIRKDSTDVYFLFSDSGSGAIHTYNTMRPFKISLGTGNVSIGGNSTDGPILYANSQTNRVGIRNSSPAQTLDVNGVAQATRFISTVANGTSPYSCTSLTINTNLNADLLDGWHAVGLSGNTIYKSGIVGSNNNSTSTSRWFKLASFQALGQNIDVDIVLLLHSGYNLKSSLLHIRFRALSGNPATSCVLFANRGISKDDIKLYYGDSATYQNQCELWVNVGGAYGVMKAVVLSESDRAGTRRNIVTLYRSNSNSVTDTPTLPHTIQTTYSNQVTITNDTDTDAAYPLLWAPQAHNNDMNSTIRKSYDYLRYNPGKKLILQKGTISATPATARLTDANITTDTAIGAGRPHFRVDVATSSMTSNKPATTGIITTYHWDYYTNYTGQLFVGVTEQALGTRQLNYGSWGAWRYYASTGASLNPTIGSTSKPVYVNAGVLTACGNLDAYKLLSISPYTTDASIQFYKGLPTISTTAEDGKAFATAPYIADTTNTVNRLTYYYPEGYAFGSTTINYMNIRVAWDTTFYHDFYMSPNVSSTNCSYLWHRAINSNKAVVPWRRIVEETNSTTWNIGVSNVSIVNDTDSNVAYPVLWTTANNTNAANSAIKKSYNNFTYNPNTKTLSVEKLNIRSNAATDHIKFNRVGMSYLTAPSDTGSGISICHTVSKFDNIVFVARTDSKCVGIGTYLPSEKLHIKSGNLKLESLSTDNAGSNIILTQNNTNVDQAGIKSNKCTLTYLRGNRGEALVCSTATAGYYVTMLRSNSTNGIFTVNNFLNKFLIGYTSNDTINAASDNNKLDKQITFYESGNIEFPGSVKSSSGFIKIGKDDTSVLLAGGGTKALTEFVTSSGTVGGTFTPVYLNNGVVTACRCTGNSVYANDATNTGIQNRVVTVASAGVTELGRVLDFHSTSYVKDWDIRIACPTDIEENTKYTLNLPKKSGTFAITGDIPTVNNEALTLQLVGTTIANDFTSNGTAKTYNIPAAASDAYGVVKVAATDSDAKTTNDTDSGRYIGVRRDNDGKLYVGIPTYLSSIPVASSSALGGIKLGFTNNANNGDFAVKVSSLKAYVNIPQFVGASSDIDGTMGLVPLPKKADRNKFLRGDGTWAAVSAGSTYTLTAATASALGGIKIGYILSGKNYPVVLDSNNKAYVNVPWNNTPSISDFTSNSDFSILMYSEGSGNIGKSGNSENNLTYNPYHSYLKLVKGSYTALWNISTGSSSNVFWFYAGPTNNLSNCIVFTHNITTQLTKFWNEVEITNHTITADGFYESSDIKKKTNIIDIKDRDLSSIKFKEFDWKESGKHQFGVIAQEIEESLPELVNTDAEGYKSVNYIGLLILKIKLLEDEITKLKSRYE